jgi:hypothetical protein
MQAGTGAEVRPRRLGIIASRHEMPVEEYLVANVNPGQSAYDLIYETFSGWLETNPGIGRRPDRPLEIYYSGLTEATLAVTDALHNFGCRYTTLMRFDRVLQDYEPLHRHMVACPLQDESA